MKNIIEQKTYSIEIYKLIWNYFYAVTFLVKRTEIGPRIFLFLKLSFYATPKYLGNKYTFSRKDFDFGVRIFVKCHAIFCLNYTGNSKSNQFMNIVLSFTSKFVPDTSRQSSTGSSITMVFSHFLKCERKVVLPLPMFPSIQTVYGRFPCFRGDIMFSCISEKI